MNPATGEPIESYEHCSLSEAFQKIQALSHQQKIWAVKPLEERASVLKTLATQLLLSKEKLAKRCTLEMGKPYFSAVAEVEKCARGLESMADLALSALKTRAVSAHYLKTEIQPEPYGIVFSIQPWNFPYWQLFRMAAGAWMAGNLVVLKHSDEVAGCAELIEEVCSVNRTQLLLNLRLTHDDAAEVIKSRWVQAVTLTGSTSAGKRVAEVAGFSLKKCILELGGSDAYLVMPDCELEKAAFIAAQSRLINSGQSCIAGKRFFVHEKIFLEFKNQLRIEMGKYPTGDPFDEKTKVGPLAGSRHLRRFQEQIKGAQALGAKMDWILEALPEKGFFAQKGILDFGSALKAFETEEIFGPVASLYRFTDLDETIQQINQGPFGLGGGIFTRDLELANSVSRKMQVGAFAVNSFVQSDPRVPFGGTKESGLGRELGLEGLFDFVSWKVVGWA